MSQRAIVTFTARGFDDIVDERGSKAWRLDLNMAYHAKYLVCVQNRRRGDLDDGSSPSAPHGEAFLIGRISAIVPLAAWPGRWMINIDEYASIGMPNVWPGGLIPVRYMTLEELGINLNALTFHPLRAESGKDSRLTEEGSPDGPLVIEETKQKLAAAYSVPPEAIKITIEL